MKRIYVSDLDGTLLNENANLSDYSKDRLNGLINEDNIHFTVATARNVYSIKEMFKDVKLKLPVIEFNGSFITDIKTGKKIIINNIDNNIIEGFLDLCKEYKQFPLISAFNGVESNLYYKPNISEGMDLYLKDRREINPNSIFSAESSLDYLEQEITCFTLINKKEILDDLINNIQKKYGKYFNIYYNRDIYYKDWYWASLYSKQATKGNAIKELLKYLGIENYHVTVFGDHDNDVDMFKIADTSVAMGNAENKLKEHADCIIGTNKEDSVIRYISSDIINYVEK